MRIKMHLFTHLIFLVLFVSRLDAFDKTDTITWGGSNDRTGYQNNHNMDPAVVGSAQFGLLFKTLLPGTWTINGQNVPEQIFSQPLVYTGSDGVQYLYIATTQNNVYKLNAKTGVIVASRNLHRPFLVSDLDGCVDINPTVGVTATGVIDPDTDTWYLTAKTYIDPNPNGPTGRPNGRYFIHAINTRDLSEQPNFPVNLEGMVARNNPVRSFNGGIHHQRPGLLHYGQYIYAGFASHCVQYNYTGWLVGWDKASGQLVERFTTEGAGIPNTTPGAGIWMSGGGIASDGKGSMFFASGNGYASQLNGIPVNGRSPPTSLEEAAVHMAINDDGSVTVVDFFTPWEKVQLDGADKDLGTTPLELLPSQFQCGNITRMGIVTGKSGKTYWLDLDNLGGYQNGPNKLDNVIQVYQNENSVYAGAGVYPLEGGYIYINVIQYPTHVFKFSCNNGVPYFNKVADSPENNAFTLGVGHGTVTSLNDQPGTGLVWTSDVEGSNLRVYNAIPNGGLLTEINSFVTPGTTKFTRPVFGDGVVYQGTTLGYIYAYGAPVNLPMNCTSVQFGLTNLNSTSAMSTIQCQANTPITVTVATLLGNPNFRLSGLPQFPIQVAQGQNFSFQAQFAPATVGPLSSAVILNTTQQATGFSINTPVQLKGTGQSQSPLLALTPNTVTWNGVITGQQTGGVNQSLIISNAGNNALNISNIKYSVTSETGPWILPNGTSAVTVVSAFTFYNIPTSIPANSAVTIPINFNPLKSGNYAVYVQVISNGGSKIFDVIAAGSDNPIAVLEFQNFNGGWTHYQAGVPFSFGNVTENTSRYLKLRLTNNGTSNAAPISITVSKPPFAIPGSIIGASNQIDLAEGTLVPAGQSVTANLYCSVPKSQIDVNSYNGTAQWTMNLNDPTFGKQYMQFFCNAVSEQAAPLNTISQQGIYRYAGCFTEYISNRQLQVNMYSDSNNTNERCIATCSAAGYIYAGTQYNSECWCGYNRPKTLVSESNCNYACSGNVNEICGGNGVNQAGTYISVFGDITRWNGNSTDAPGPYVNPGNFGFNSIGCYTEATQGRALSVPATSNQTVSGCLQACQGYLFAGIEYGGECYCGNSLGTTSTNASLTDCSMTCNKNQTEFCGGPSRLNMYIYGNGTIPQNPTSTSTYGNNNNVVAPTPTGLTIPPTIGKFSYVSCFTEATNGRALSGYALADNSMTLQLCAANCTSFQYFAVEYGRECYCGNILSSGSTVATDGRCNMGCAGNSSLACGGPNGLQLYQQGNISSTSTSSTSSSSSTSISPNKSKTNNFQYVDCHTEATNSRALTGRAVISSDMTVQYCAGNCTGYMYMAVEYSSECYCGNSLNSGSVTATDGRCSMSCAGDSSSICGGPNGLSLYQYIAPVTAVNTTSSLSATNTSTTVLSKSTGTSSSSNSTISYMTPSSTTITSGITSNASTLSTVYVNMTGSTMTMTSGNTSSSWTSTPAMNTTSPTQTKLYISNTTTSTSSMSSTSTMTPKSANQTVTISTQNTTSMSISSFWYSNSTLAMSTTMRNVTSNSAVWSSSTLMTSTRLSNVTTTASINNSTAPATITMTVTFTPTGQCSGVFYSSK